MMSRAKAWIDAATGVAKPAAVEVECLSQGWGAMQWGMSINDAGTPLCLGGKTYEVGFGTHADGDIRVRTALPAKRLRVTAGVDDNDKTRRAVAAKMSFAVQVGAKTVWSCPPRGAHDGAVEADVDLGGAQEFHMIVRAEGGKRSYAHADWIQPVVTLSDGTTVELARRGSGLGAGSMPPFSFHYAGRSSREFLPTWQVARTREALPDGVRLHRTAYKDPRTNLECVMEMQSFADFPAARWVVRLRNAGTADTPILEDIRALDTTWLASPKAMLHYAKGSTAKIDDFLPVSSALPRMGFEEPPLEFLSDNGRSSSSWLPFFNLRDGQSGVILGIGWTGQWSATFSPEVNGSVRARAGVEKTHLVLHPGEEIRTPSVLALFWQDDDMGGHNLLRRFILRHNAPQENGRPVTTPLSFGAWGAQKSEGHLENIRRLQAAGLPYDVYWIDAGWFGDSTGKSQKQLADHWYTQAGNWNIDKSLHPNELVDVSEAARKAGMVMLLWVETERAVWGSQMTKEHPDWYLGERKEGASVLLNLGNPDARKWATDFVSNLVDKLDLTWYRQDFNMPSLAPWRANDAPDRQGMTEIRHVEGLYAFWDELRRKHPGLKIDDCASGGRRIDIEMLARSIPLWRSDYQCFPPLDPTAGQVHTMGLSSWAPLHGTAASAEPMDTYAFRSYLSPGLGVGFPPEAATDRKIGDWHRAMIAQYRRARPFFYGDYYPLTKVSADNDAWAGYQLHQADLDAGLVMLFRRAESPFSAATLKLRGLDASAAYEIEDVDAGTKTRVSGKDLMAGTTWTMETPRLSRMIFYRTLK